MHEFQMHPDDSCHFATLTYRDDALIYDPAALMPHATLWPPHTKTFLKTLRKYQFRLWRKANPTLPSTDYKSFRFYLCGEYGDKSNRPHYHVLIFGLIIPDKKLHTIHNNNKLYTSQLLNKLWSHGNTLIGDLTFESAAYTARYCLKKTVHPPSYYKENGLYPQFARMSNRPGIGATWYDKFKGDLFPYDICYTRNGQKTKPPRYYMKKLELENPALFAIIKNERNIAAQKNTDATDKVRLNIKRKVKLSKIKALIRPM